MPRIEPVIAQRIEAAPAALTIVFEDREVRIAWDRCSPKLAAATAPERQHAELSPGGYGVHWPLVDEDLSIAGLMRSAGGGKG